MVKRSIKLLISLIVYFVTELQDRVYLLFLGKKPPARQIVLYYHAVTEDELPKFSKQMDFLLRFTKPFSIANGNCRFKAGERYAAVTFDDGLSETVRRVIPELIQRNIPITIFVPSSWLGEKPSWIRDPLDPSVKERVLSVDELQEVMKNEFVTIGSHCRTHCSLLSLDDAGGKNEIVQSKKDLEGLLAKAVDLISFPYGDYQERHVEWAWQAGYKKAFGILPTLYPSDGFVSGRVRVDPSDWPLEFKMKLMGAYRWLPWLIRLKRILISGNSSSMASMEMGRRMRRNDQKHIPSEK